ncbi:Hypothetical predicted protein [Pelobates cultripes]|uniref:Uncharacterized protein n=2 Tax=Pelobates cultripes TaxID=61616 RepID=A0AAD1SHQ5_PELCU|nr:Hypothetical predicted protein [Pelobates cultripes]
MPRQKKSCMLEQSSFGQEELYYMVEFLTKQRYDNLPTGTRYTSTIKRRIMVALSNRLEHKCGVKRSVRQLQKRWSDMKRREADFLLQVQMDINRKRNHKDVEELATVTATEGNVIEAAGMTDYTDVEAVAFEQPDVTITIIPKDEEPDTVMLDDFAPHEHLQAAYKVDEHVQEEYCAAKVAQHEEEGTAIAVQGLVEEYKQSSPCTCGTLQKIYKELVQQGQRLRNLEEKVNLLLLK